MNGQQTWPDMGRGNKTTYPLNGTTRDSKQDSMGSRTCKDTKQHEGRPTSQRSGRRNRMGIICHQIQKIHLEHNSSRASEEMVTPMGSGKERKKLSRKPERQVSGNHEN